MRRRLAAILAGDVVGYSRMMAKDETATYRDLRSLFDDIVGPAVARNRGRIFKQTGDGFLASFASAHEALEAAGKIQSALASRRFDLRIGVNVGDVIEEDDDTYGNSVNVAARLESMARPGSIYVSDAVRRSAEPSAAWPSGLWAARRRRTCPWGSMCTKSSRRPRPGSGPVSRGCPLVGPCS